MSVIGENIAEIKKDILQNAKKTGRAAEDVVLIAVTKTVEADKMNEAIREGITDIGENKVQEILRKYDDVEEDVRWHLIGSLQSNKVKYIIDKVDLIHSLDRISLAKEIDKRAGENGKIMDCLVQVNISQEDSKHGVAKEDVAEFIRTVSSNYKNIRILGLMGMAPFTEDSEETRTYFKQLKDISVQIEGMNMESVKMECLSMGMSNDYKVAIQEGSNMVRIGTAIFGERNYES